MRDDDFVRAIELRDRVLGAVEAQRARERNAGGDLLDTWNGDRNGLRPPPHGGGSKQEEDQCGHGINRTTIGE